MAGLTQVVCNDDTSGLQSQVTFPAVVGQRYRIQVDGFNTATGAITLRTCSGIGNDSFGVRGDHRRSVRYQDGEQRGVHG